MWKHLRCHKIYKEVILEKTKQRVAILTLRIVRVLHVHKVADELSDPFANVGAQQADNDSSNPPENFHKNGFNAIFLLKYTI